MEQPKISVVVPIFNVELFLLECLDSLASQTLEGIELILVDDGSTDQSAAIAAAFAARVPSAILFRKPNGGLSDARNFGLRYARGQYVAFMDSDDWVARDYYERLWSQAMALHADVACSDICYKYTDREVLVKGAFFGIALHKEDAGYSAHLPLTFHMVQNKIFRKSLLDSIMIQFPKGLFYEDLSFFYRLYPYLETIVYTPYAGLFYRQRDGSIMTQFSHKIMDIEVVLLGIKNWYAERGLYSSYYHELEYCFARHLLLTSYGRILRSRNPDFIKQATRSHWRLLTHEFPNWRDNRYLWDKRLLRTWGHSVYLRFLRRHSYQFIVAVLSQMPWLVSKIVSV